MEPIKEKQQLTVKILQINTDGDGMGNYGDYIIYVPDALPNDTVKIKVRRVSGRIVYGELLEKLNPDGEQDENYI